MKICAHNPSQPEYSLCGDATDAPETENDVDDFQLAIDVNKSVTCENCKRAISDIYSTYTQTGRLK